MDWKEAKAKGGLAPDNVHMELRSAFMREDKEEILRVLEEKQIPLSAFNCLIKTILVYHDKKDMLLFYEELLKKGF